MSRNNSLSEAGKYKGIKNQRQGQIYDYYRQQLVQTKNQDLLDLFTDLPPSQQQIIAQALTRAQKLSKEEHRQVLQQTNQAYREEIAEQTSQLRYLKAKIGATSRSLKELNRSERFKYFWLEKGEHKIFRQKKKAFELEWKRIRDQTKGQRIKSRTELLRIYKTLYEKSPWRIRDRFVVRTNQPDRRFSFKEIKEKYLTNNPFAATKKHYFRAMIELSRRTEPRGEKVPDAELALDRYGYPQFKEGQVISLDSKTPGRTWSVYRHHPPLEAVIQKEVHEVAHEGYLQEHGTALEIQTWKLKKNKALCWVEAMGLGDCSANVGTSNWWCLECIYAGPYHPPVLPKHCPWEYTYRPQVCAGTQKHADANKQWHFSVEGEKRRDKIKGGDWGSCHIGTFGMVKKKKSRAKKNWIIPK